jgi:hypothetical protein
MKRLAPDAEELRHAAHVSIPACPFCGASPIVWTEQNETTGYYVGRVTCTVCHGGMHHCAESRAGAREGAIRDWSKRSAR